MFVVKPVGKWAEGNMVLSLWEVIDERELIWIYKTAVMPFEMSLHQTSHLPSSAFPL